MKLKSLLIPYAFIIVIVPTMLTYAGPILGLSMSGWQWIMDGIMAVTAIVGLIATLISRKKNFHGWISLIILAVLFILPQLYIWKTQNKGLNELRYIYRFALLYITLFIVPSEVHFSRREICILIGLFVLFGLFCCGYELRQHPKPWEYMVTISGHVNDRVRSFFNQRNRFGAYLALLFILCIFAVQVSGKKYWFVPAVIFAAFLVATESRGAMLLAVIFSFCCLISYHRRFGWKNIGMVLLDILIVAILVWLIPPLRNFIQSWIDVDRGVTGRDRIWQVSFEYFREANPFLGHGIGVEIERVMVERLSAIVSTHNAYLYILNSGGIIMVIFYILSVVMLLRHSGHRHHYLIPLLIGVLGYAFFELACTPFDYFHLSNMFTICIFFFPSVAAGSHHQHHQHHHHHKDNLPVHWNPEDNI